METPTAPEPIKKKQLKCSFTAIGCTDRVVKIIGDCRYCEQKFCSKHRLPEAHQCTNIKTCKDNAAGRNAQKLMHERTVSNKV